tara:strand:+ start:12735 stop:13544 length:810 start_codon:yes stop_codon:yes gene_type:complete
LKKFEVEISIIVGTYNEKKKNIEQLISSIINQKFKNYELIVIDDSDNAIIREFWQLELKKVPVSTYIKTGKKQPLAKACNFGVKHAKGEFIARIDSDDYMDYNRLSKQYDYLTKNRATRLIGTGVIKIDTDSTVLEKRTYPSGNNIPNYLFFMNPFAHSTFMFYKKDFVKLNLYDEETRHAEDYDLIMKYFYNSYRIENLDEPLVYLRMPPASRRPRNHYIYILKVRLRYFKIDRYLFHRIIGILLGSLVVIAPNFIRDIIYKFYNRVF